MKQETPAEAGGGATTARVSQALGLRAPHFQENNTQRLQTPAAPGDANTLPTPSENAVAKTDAPEEGAASTKPWIAMLEDLSDQLNRFVKVKDPCYIFKMIGLKFAEDAVDATLAQVAKACTVTDDTGTLVFTPVTRLITHLAVISYIVVHPSDGRNIIERGREFNFLQPEHDNNMSADRIYDTAPVVTVKHQLKALFKDLKETLWVFGYNIMRHPCSSSPPCTVRPHSW